MLGPDMLEEIKEMVKKVQVNLKVSQDRQKNFPNQMRSFWEFHVGYHVYIRVRAKKSSLQWTESAKLAARFYGPFQILA